MQLAASLPTPPVRLVVTLLALPPFAIAAARAPWRTWLGGSDRQHLWPGSLVLRLPLWSLRAGVTPGLTVQFLLVSTLVLMRCSITT